ncbi:MAG: hypothetical protein PHI85_10350 [Victivallaceae bacterium]|nr:hypothetical protein [Victivallaceae bacterium]
MLYPIAAAVLAAFAVIVGMLTGNAESKRKLFKKLLLGVGIVLIGCGVFGVFLWANIGHFARYLLSLRPDLAVLAQAMNQSAAITGLFWPLIAGVTGMAEGLFLIAFNCRRSGGRRWMGLAGTLVAVVALNFTALWLFQGVTALIALFRDFSYEANFGVAFFASLLVLGGLCLIGVLYAFFGGKAGWRGLMTQLLVLIAGSLAVWPVALAAASLYAMKVRDDARSRGIEPVRIVQKTPPELAAAGNPDYDYSPELFSLPVAGGLAWLGDGADGRSTVSPEQREYTLKKFDSPELVRRGADDEAQLRRLSADNRILYFDMLKLAREYTHRCAGRAALYRESGQPEKILPELWRLTALDREILADSPFVIVELVRIACRSTWVDYVVKLGPDGAEYAPEYRRALEFMKSRRVYLPSEAGHYLWLLNNYSPVNYGEYAALPLAKASYAGGLAAALELGDRTAELTSRELFDKDVTASYKKYISERMAFMGRRSLVMGTTALALKCHRAEYGVYPDTLAVLVPEYLDKVPVNPLTGGALNYRTDGASFTLTPPDSDIAVISSVPKY